VSGSAQDRIVTVRMFRSGPNRVITQLPGGFVDHAGLL
jgi:hypothetical protein